MSELNTTERIAQLLGTNMESNKNNFSGISVDQIEIDHHFVQELKRQDTNHGSTGDERRMSFEGLLARNKLGIISNWMEFWDLYDKVEKKVRANPFYIHIQP